MTAPFSRNARDERWAEAPREHGDRIATIPPNGHLTDAVEDLRPGHALDAGCGHGSDTLRPAVRGCQVTAVDSSATALHQAT